MGKSFAGDRKPARSRILVGHCWMFVCLGVKGRERWDEVEDEDGGLQMKPVQKQHNACLGNISALALEIPSQVLHVHTYRVHSIIWLLTNDFLWPYDFYGGAQVSYSL